MQAQTEKLGDPETYANYPVGWAWAMNAPLRWVKQHASMLGGVRNGLILSWPGHVSRPGSVCAEFCHLVDLVPTVLEATGLPAPEMVYGVAQTSMDGQGWLPSLASYRANRPRTQYFEITGKMGLNHDGWFPSGDDGRFTIDVNLRLAKLDASGAVTAWGSRFGGWSLYLDQGRSAFAWAQSTDPRKMAQVTAQGALPAGTTKLRLGFVVKPDRTAEAILSTGGRELARVKLPGSVLVPAGNGESLDIGRDLGVMVTD